MGVRMLPRAATTIVCAGLTFACAAAGDTPGAEQHECRSKADQHAATQPRERGRIGKTGQGHTAFTGILR